MKFNSLLLCSVCGDYLSIKENGTIECDRCSGKSCNNKLKPRKIEVYHTRKAPRNIYVG